MTAVVTGAAGHVGGNLVRALLAQGRKVRAMVHEDLQALEGLDVEIIKGDVCEPASLREAFRRAEAVYHAAGYISLQWNEWKQVEAVNVLGVRNVVEACQACGVKRLVHFSSIHALQQEPLDLPLDESRPLVSASRYPPYDRSKAAGEKEVRRAIEQGLDAVILYPTGIIGPYDFRPSHFGEVLLLLANGKMPALVKAGFDWVDVRDVAAAALCCEDLAPAGARYLLSGHWVSIPDLAAQVAAISGTPAPRLIFPMSLARLGAPFVHFFQRKEQRPLFTSVSLHALRGNRDIRHERASRELGYRPRPFEETLKDTLNWFVETGRLSRPSAAPTN